jgi:hypothetical protein
VNDVIRTGLLKQCRNMKTLPDLGYQGTIFFIAP